MFEVVGRTEDGRPVVGGVYRFYETYGLPLEVVFETLHEKGLVPCWIRFHRECVNAGMKHERILFKLDPALSDVYGSEFRDRVLQGLDRLLAAGILRV